MYQLTIGWMPLAGWLTTARTRFLRPLIVISPIEQLA